VLRLRCLLLIAAAATFLLTGPASAASISQVQWSVTAGSFSSPTLANGLVEGGSLTFRPFAGTVSTSFVGTHSGYFSFSAVGSPGNTFGLSPWSGSLFLSPGSGAFMSVSFFAQAYSGGGALPSARIASIVPLFKQLYMALGSGSLGAAGISGRIGAFTHTFTLGNEVRTGVVPEPTTGALLGLGLLVGLAGTAARTRRRD
jgi:hypothetical protein